MHVKLPNGRIFYFRGKHDGSIILSHFCNDNYFIDDTRMPVRTIIDGGAFIGDETVRFRGYYPDARIVAVEAAKENFDMLEKNCGSDDLTTLVYGAIYPHPAKITMKAANSLQAFTVVAAESGDDAVPTWDMPSLIELLPTSEVDILKLDIEGSEFELFSKNTDSWIGKVRAIIFEVDFHRPDLTQTILRALNRFDFRIYVSGENLVMIRSDVPWMLRQVRGLSRPKNS
jgi:FkbM family methyltransferase